MQIFQNVSQKEKNRLERSGKQVRNYVSWQFTTLFYLPRSLYFHLQDHEAQDQAKDHEAQVFTAISRPHHRQIETLYPRCPRHVYGTCPRQCWDTVWHSYGAYDYLETRLYW